MCPEIGPLQQHALGRGVTVFPPARFGGGDLGDPLGGHPLALGRHAFEQRLGRGEDLLVDLLSLGRLVFEIDRLGRSLFQKLHDAFLGRQAVVLVLDRTAEGEALDVGDVKVRLGVDAGHLPVTIKDGAIDHVLVNEELVRRGHHAIPAIIPDKHDLVERGAFEERLTGLDLGADVAVLAVDLEGQLAGGELAQLDLAEGGDRRQPRILSLVLLDQGLEVFDGMGLERLEVALDVGQLRDCLLYTSPSPRDS